MNKHTLRESHASITLIRRRVGSDWAYLCQWSDSWRAMHFIGGHREEGESFYQCAVREAQEELGHAAAKLLIPPDPVAHLDYVTYSESAQQPTRYLVAVYLVAATRFLQEHATTDPANGWVGRDDIRRGTLTDGRRVSPTVALLLNKLKQQAAF